MLDGSESTTEAQRLLAQTQQAARIGSWEIELDTGTWRWSDELFALHGLLPDDEDDAVSGPLRRVHPDDVAALSGAMARHLDRRGPWVGEYRIVHPVFGPRTLLTRGEFLEADGTRPDRLSGTAQDVTEVRALQARLDHLSEPARAAAVRAPEDDLPDPWADQVRDALANDGFDLLAQPIVSLQGDGPPQFELLLRMRGTDGQLVPAGSFLAVAERLGLIAEIDRWVVGRAIDTIAAQRALGRDLRLEVNLSGRSIGDDLLLESLERHLHDAHVPANRLIFEITETAAVADISRAAGFATALGEVGCRFALDDFGAGFGSFYYLKHLPFDYLKIDGEFVKGCASSEADRLVIGAVVQIARGMGKRTIGEFVGGPETVEVLRRLGVDYGQGHHLGRPARLDEHLTGALAA